MFPKTLYGMTVNRDAIVLLQGTLDLLILKTLSWGSAHGYAIARWIQQVTDDALQIEEGSLYPSLHRLEKRGLIRATWGLSENKRRAKYYELTARGRHALRAEASSWAAFVGAVAKVLASSDQPSWAK